VRSKSVSQSVICEALLKRPNAFMHAPDCVIVSHHVRLDHQRVVLRHYWTERNLCLNQVEILWLVVQCLLLYINAVFDRRLEEMLFLFFLFNDWTAVPPSKALKGQHYSVWLS